MVPVSDEALTETAARFQDAWFATLGFQVEHTYYVLRRVLSNGCIYAAHGSVVSSLLDTANGDVSRGSPASSAISDGWSLQGH